MTHFRTLFAILGALWLTGCSAPSSSPLNDTPPSPAIWQMTAPDGKTGWLFGTIHALPEGKTWRTRVFDEAYAQAGVLVLEATDIEGGGSVADAFARLAIAPGQPPLFQRVEPQHAKAVVELAENLGYGDESFAMMETWAVALTLSREDGPPGLGVDRQLLRMQDGKVLVGLEMAEDQLAAFDGLSPQNQAALLVAVAQMAGEPGKREQRAASWRAGDLAFLEKETHEGMMRDPDLRKALLEGRNRRWLPKVEALVESGRRPFVAVGAAHLVSEVGLPVLLRREGYTVHRIQ